MPRTHSRIYALVFLLTLLHRLQERFALLAEAEYFQLADAVKVINETSTRTGDSADLHTIAQIVSKRLKVEKVSVPRANMQLVQNRYGGHVPVSCSTVEAYKVTAV